MLLKQCAAALIAATGVAGLATPGKRSCGEKHNHNSTLLSSSSSIANASASSVSTGGIFYANGTTSSVSHPSGTVIIKTISSDSPASSSTKSGTVIIKTISANSTAPISSAATSTLSGSIIIKTLSTESTISSSSAASSTLSGTVIIKTISANNTTIPSSSASSTHASSAAITSSTQASSSVASSSVVGSSAASSSLISSTQASSTKASSTQTSSAATSTGTAAASSGTAKVFAHYMVGNTYGQTTTKWTTDITAAKNVGIDGFALNIGTDDYTDAQLALAYEVAETVGFDLFISFDMQASSWDATTVSGYINLYKNSSAQFKVNDLPFVSTFEGPSWASNWATVRSSTGGIYLVPDWASLGATQVGAQKSLIDGACESFSEFFQ
jgi:hypothetical protein